MALPPRSVWVDAQGAQNVSTPERGIPRHVIEVVGALLDVVPEAIGAIGVNPALPTPPGLERLGLDRLARAPVGPGTEPTEPPLIYHLPSPFEGVRLERIWPPWARIGGVRTVVTVHDLVPLVFRGRYLDENPYMSAFYLGRMDLIREADRVLAISQCSAADAVEYLGVDERRVTVIDSGVTPDMSSLIPSGDVAAAVLAEGLPEIRDGFMLYVGGDDWRKNLDGLVAAYGLLPEAVRRRHQLVIACRLSPEVRRDLVARAVEAGVDPGDLVLTGFVSDRQLSALYRACDLFVFPSLYEGAGLPILEAMSCGAPVIAGGVASIPEVFGDRRGTFDPGDPSEIAACIERTLDDPAELDFLRERSARRAAHFTWERVARLIAEGYEEALRVPARRPGQKRRRRIAVLTAWPPAPESGLGTELLAQLTELGDVDTIVPRGVGLDGAPPGVTLRSADDFEWRHALLSYDRFLYVLGDSAEHFHVLDGLMRRPGTVLAERSEAGGLFRALYGERYADDPDWLRETYEDFGDRLLGPGIERGENGDPEGCFERFMLQVLDARAEHLVEPADAGRLAELLT